MQQAYTVLPHHAPYGGDTDARLVSAFADIGVTGEAIAELGVEDVGRAVAKMVGSTQGMVLATPLGVSREAQAVWWAASEGCGFSVPMNTSDPVEDIVVKYTDGEDKVLGYFCYVQGDGFSAVVLPQ
jgi:hypothetical protein